MYARSALSTILLIGIRVCLEYSFNFFSTSLLRVVEKRTRFFSSFFGIFVPPFINLIKFNTFFY
nr:MAG TPA: hypothetical protein [Bacteriophage sp.]